MNITIYHNPRCSKSRACLALLEEKGLDFEIINYLKTPLSIVELEVLVSKLGISPKDLIRTKETIFKENYKDKTLSDKEWLAVLAAQPQMIERPIVATDKKAAIGRPLGNVINLLT